VIELRFLKKKDGSKILQYREWPTAVHWSKTDDEPYFGPASRQIDLRVDKNFTEWKDIPMVDE
jgi:hypothetical protein